MLLEALFFAFAVFDFAAVFFARAVAVRGRFVMVFPALTAALTAVPAAASARAAMEAARSTADRGTLKALARCLLPVLRAERERATARETPEPKRREIRERLLRELIEPFMARCTVCFIVSTTLLAFMASFFAFSAYFWAATSSPLFAARTAFFFASSDALAEVSAVFIAVLDLVDLLGASDIPIYFIQKCFRVGLVHRIVIGHRSLNQLSMTNRGSLEE
jgi:hypothetical protein